MDLVLTAVTLLPLLSPFYRGDPGTWQGHGRLPDLPWQLLQKPLPLPLLLHPDVRSGHLYISSPPTRAKPPKSKAQAVLAPRYRGDHVHRVRRTVVSPTSTPGCKGLGGVTCMSIGSFSVVRSRIQYHPLLVPDLVHPMHPQSPGLECDDESVGVLNPAPHSSAKAGSPLSPQKAQALT